MESERRSIAAQMICCKTLISASSTSVRRVNQHCMSRPHLQFELMCHLLWQVTVCIYRVKEITNLSSLAV